MSEAFKAMKSSTSTAAPIAGTAAASSRVHMDSRVWRHLPAGLIDRVLAFLPPPAFFRLRITCKRWYSLLFSDSFLETHLRLSPRRRWLVFFLIPSPVSSFSAAAATGDIPPPPALFLDPKTNSWLRLPLDSFIPPGFSAAAASGGILCFISDAAGPKSLILCNPFSKLVAHPPPTPRPRLYPSVGFTAADTSLSLIVAGDDLISRFAVKNLTAECFHADGATGFFSPWDTVSPLPRLCSPDPPRFVFAARSFYCMSSAPFSVLAYDLVTSQWSKIQAPMRRFLRSPSLAAGGPSTAAGVLMVAAVEKSKLSVPKSVRVWALQPGSRAWAEIERMPPEIHRQFTEAEGGRGFEAAGDGEIIAITIRGSLDIILFDFARKEWRWAPPSPYPSGTTAASGVSGLRGFAYEPRLATPAMGLVDSSSLSFQSLSA
ncbi:Protein unusual floral organs [Apostasia shenzhenica]|uniref:Protein unusual floral organs n=1 Tax=Apostasia shenzhenica TaxID=1088818 RepID=A0A2I0B8I7_9ASPA|nr:Protein unusual floral organs [Apostasia shenzhenica]